MAGHHHHWNSCGRFILKKPLADLVAAEIGQAVVEEDQVGDHHFGTPHAFAAGESSDNVETGIGARESVFDEDQQHLGIVDDDNFLSGFWKNLRFGWRSRLRLRSLLSFFLARFCFAERVEKNGLPGSFDGVRRVGRSFRFISARAIPPDHLLQRTRSARARRDRMKDLAIHKMNLAGPLICRFDMQDRRRSAHALHRHEIARIQIAQRPP